MTPGLGPRPSSPALAGFCFLAALLLMMLGGCATPPQAQRLSQQWPAHLPPQVLLSEQPFFAQEDYECGPAGLAMLLQAAGVPATPEQLLPQVYLPGRQGSLQQELLAASRRHGLLSVRLAPSLEALLQEVAAGHPVLVFQNLSLPVYPVWHYAVLIGFDRERGLLTLHSGRTQNLQMSIATFERTWARGGHWAMLALPPARLPVTAQAETTAGAIAALERVDPRAAAQAYAGALQRWPAQPALLLGAGNSAYASGDLAGAASAYRHAVQVRPELADAWNNLAQVLLEQGQHEQARQAAARAVQLGGARLPLYLELQRKLDPTEPEPRTRID